MKNFTFLILLCTCIGLSAQNYEYVPLVREGIEWGYANIEYSFHGDLTGAYSSHRIRLVGDTLISGKTYKKCFAYTSCVFDEKDAFNIGWIREENKKVYFLYNSKINIYDFYKTGGIPFQDPNSTERIIYDFTPEKVGDVVNLDILYPEEFIVSKVEYIKINDSLRKLITLGAQFSGDITIVEGIGIFKNGGGDLIFPHRERLACMCSEYTTYLNYIRTFGGLYEYKNRDDIPLEFKDCTGSVGAINNDNIQISKTNGTITIEIPESGYHVVELVNTAGLEVFKKIIQDNTELTIPTTGYSPGMYLLTIHSENERYTKKIIIK